MYELRLYQIVNCEAIQLRRKTYPNENGQCSKAVSELNKWEQECKADHYRYYKIVFDYVTNDNEIINIGTIKIKGGKIQ